MVDGLLDTNVVVALIAGEVPVVERIAGAARVLLPSIVVGELYYGALRSGRSEANVARVDALVAARAVLARTAATAHTYGEVKDGLRRAGGRSPRTTSGSPRWPSRTGCRWPPAIATSTASTG